MKRKRIIDRMLIFLVCGLILLTGCQNSVQQPESTEAPVTEAPVESTEAPETEPESTEVPTEPVPEVPVDRYNEIVNLSGTEGKLAVFFLDLEEVTSGDEHSGDCTLLISPDGKVMLIDAGHTPCGDEITAFLKELGIAKIDYLVASHAHIDHIGGMPEIVANFEIGVHYRTPVEYTTQTYANYVSAIENAGIPVEYVHEGDSFMFGEYIQVDVYNPPEEIEYPDATVSSWNQFMNDHSMLMKMTYGESTFLFGGDLYVAAEQLLMQEYAEELKVDVAKVNHHGYSTSTCRKWVKTTAPLIAVAMGDEMGSMDTYERYTKEGAAYYHTFVDGFVRVVADDSDNYEVIAQYDSWLHKE